MSVVDIAAMHGLTPARIRQVVAEHNIEPTGRNWKAKLYDPNEIAQYTGWKHRPYRPHNRASA